MSSISEKISRILGVFLILSLFITPVAAQPVPTPDFPIGLTLTYEGVDDYFMDVTIRYTESFEVLNWRSPDNSSFQLRNGYAQGGDSMSYSIRNVSYPSWDYTVYDYDFNETVFGAMYPLWRDVSNWERGQNITIGYGTYVYREFTVSSYETISVGDVRVYCWVMECEFIDENDWEYTLRHYYDIQYGILIKTYVHRWPGIDDMNNIGTFTDTLVSTNILDKLESSSIMLFGLNLTSLLLLGIGIEVIIIVVLYMRRKIPSSPSIISLE